MDDNKELVEFKKKFWGFVAKGKKSECWEWQGGLTKQGYGCFYFKGAIRAHRASWMIANGDIPKGMCVCHSCDNPPCVNPNHLWLGTYLDNARDRDKKGRGVYNCGKRKGVKYCKGEGHGRAVLKESDIPIIRQDPRVFGVIAREYGVHETTIQQIKAHKIWRHI